MINGSTHPGQSIPQAQKANNEPAPQPSADKQVTGGAPDKHLRKKKLSNFSVKPEVHTQKYLTESLSPPSQRFPEYHLTMKQKRALRTPDVLMQTKHGVGFTRLHQAIRDMNWEQVQRILQLTPQAILEKDTEGNNAVHLAATWGFSKCLYRMIETPQGFEALSVKNHQGFYPLCCLLGEKFNITFDKGLLNTDPNMPLQASYHESLTTLEEKHDHEAVFAKSVLEDPENIALMNVMARATSQLLLAMSDEIFDDYREEVNLDLQRRNFPVSKLIVFSSKLTLSETLKALTEEDNNNRIVDIMSVLWRLSVFLLESKGSLDPERLSHIHDLLGTMGKSHDIHPEWIEEVTADNHQKFCFLSTGTLGEAAINSSLLNNLYPLKKRSHYFIECSSNHSSPPDLCQINKSCGMPYLAGPSGMANCFYAVNLLFNIDVHSAAGQRLARILTAFTIGTGENTAKEARDGLIITHEYLKCSGRLMADYESRAGIFKSLHKSAKQT